MAVFKETGSVWIIYCSILEQKMLKVKLGTYEITEFLLMGVFLQKYKFLLIYVVKTFGRPWYNWYMSVSPLPPPPPKY